jgi:hypothetical protein
MQVVAGARRDAEVADLARLTTCGSAAGRSRLMGVYSDHDHVFAYDDGEVRQEFNVSIACRVVGGALAAGDEAREVGWFTPEEFEDLPMHESVRRRIRDHGAGRTGVVA